MLKAASDAGLLGERVFATWRFGGERNVGSHTHAQLIETQCHAFYLLEHLGGPIVSVMAQMANKTHGDYTTVAIALEFADGAVGSLVGSYDSNLHCVDAATGKAVWTHGTDNYINGSPAVAEGQTVFGGCDGLLHVIELGEGKQVKEIEAGAYIAASRPNGPRASAEPMSPASPTAAAL